MAIKNPLYLDPVTESGYSSAAASQALAPQPKTTPVTPKQITSTASVGTFQSPAQDEFRAEHPFASKISDDASALLVGIPTALSNPVGTIKSIFTTEENPIGGATLQSIKDVFNVQYYKDHPLLAAINTGSWVLTVATLGAGLLVKAPLTAALEAATQAAVREGVEAGTVNAALRSGLTNKLVAGSMPSVLKESAMEAVRTGNSGIVGETVRNALIKKGVEPGIASNVAKTMADTFAAGVQKNAPVLKTLDTIGHPLKALNRAAADPIKSAVFGDAENTAVARLYGTDAVKANPNGFLGLEDWAGKQAEESGLANSLDNRQRIMMDWADEQTDWQYLNPDQRIARHENYVKASNYAKQINETTGDIIVPGRALSPGTAEAAINSIKNAPKEMTVDEIFRDLTESVGGGLKNWKATINEIIRHNPEDRNALISAITNLTRAGNMSFPSNEVAGKLIAQMELETGYVAVKPPKGKVINYAESPELSAETGTRVMVPGDGVPTKIAERSMLGNLIDKMGLSGSGTVPGTIDYLFGENFTQQALKDLGRKYGATLAADWRHIPIEELYGFLQKNRRTMQEASLVGKASTRNTLIDFGAKDFENLGFKGDVAKDIEGIVKDSMANIPWSKTGLGEGMANWARARVPGFNTYLRTAYNGRFNINPLFGAQQMIEENINMAMQAGKPVISLGQRFDQRIASTLGKVPYLKDVINPEIGHGELQLVQDEILASVSKNALEYAPELNQLVGESGKGVNTARGRAQTATSIQSRNVMHRMIGYNSAYAATNMVRALSSKFGMTTEEALGYTIKNGTKVYDNPQVYSAIRDTVDSVFNYKPGFQTSPLAKTLNVAFFPFRFEAKTLALAGTWMSKLSPPARLTVMNNLVRYANWVQTAEGNEYRQNSAAYRLINYVLPYEQMGRTVDAVTRGQLFGGNTGLIGGMPFGMLFTIARDLGFTTEDPAQVNPKTQQPYTRRVPENFFSEASAIKAFEDLTLHMMPSMPFYTLTGGAAPSVSRWYKDVIEGVYGSVKSEVTGKSPARVQTELDRQTVPVQPDYQRIQPLDFLKGTFTPATAEAATLPPGQRYAAPNDRITISKTISDEVGKLHTLKGGTQVRELSTGTKSEIAATYKAFPNLPKGIMEAVYGQESSFGTNKANAKYDQGAFGWVVGFTKGTYNGIVAKSKAGDERYTALLKHMDFSSKAAALKSAAAYLDFRANVYGEKGEVASRISDAADLYHSRYNTVKANWNPQKFTDMTQFYAGAGK